MKVRTLFSLFICLNFFNIACSQENAKSKDRITEITKKDTVNCYSIILQNNKFYFLGTEKDIFENEIIEDTVILRCNYYLDEINKIFVRSEDSLLILVNIEIGLGQNFTDDIVGSSLDFKCEVPAIKFTIKNSAFQIPNLTSLKINNIPLKNYLEREFWDQILNESYMAQKMVFEKILKRENYPQEYKAQAKIFLQKKKTDFKNIKDLRIDLVLNSVKFEIIEKNNKVNSSHIIIMK